MDNIEKEFKKWWDATHYRPTSSATNDPRIDDARDYAQKIFQAGYQKGQEQGKKEAAEEILSFIEAATYCEYTVEELFQELKTKFKIDKYRRKSE